MGHPYQLAERQGHTEKLTIHEWTGATASRWNLADGHPRQALTPRQVTAVGDVTKLFTGAEKQNERDVKAGFEAAFFGLAGQETAISLRPLSHYSGSVAIEVMANYLRLRGLTVTMAHPTFDSLADTLKRHGVPLTPMPVEETLNLTPASPPPRSRARRAPGTDALYLVIPNNPTGHCPTREQFAGIAGYCARHGILLLADFVFRFYAGMQGYDQYQVLADAGTEFIATEDTGKTWPAGDVKLAMLVASSGPRRMLEDISNDILLSVPRFDFQVISRLISAERPGTGRVLSQDVADANREVLYGVLADSPLRAAGPGHRMGLEWVRLPSGWDATGFTNWLHAQDGPQLLPGERFYWADYDQGSRYVRLALLRDPGYFAEAVASLRELSARYLAEDRPADYRAGLWRQRL
jgi:aspartate/methionine/tyrosine aminotransferase